MRAKRLFIYFFHFDIHLFQCTRLTNLSKIGWLPMELLCLPEPAVLPVPLLQHWRQWESQPQYVPQLALCKYLLIFLLISFLSRIFHSHNLGSLLIVNAHRAGKDLDRIIPALTRGLEIHDLIRSTTK